MDRLSKQLDNLESSVSNDIKTILHILKRKSGELFAAEVSERTGEIPEKIATASKSGRRLGLFWGVLKESSFV